MIRPAFADTGSPVGRQGARRIPWWASTKVQVNSSNAAAGQEFQFPGQHNNEIFVQNPFPWPLYIDEIRMWSTPITLSDTRTEYMESMKKTAFRFKSSRTGYLASKWLPGMVYNTEVDRHLMGYVNGIVYTLPSDFYLAFGSTPTMEIISLNANLNDRYIRAAMRGYDPTFNKPIVVGAREATTGTAGANTTVFAFDDGRDQQVNDMWVHDFAFASLSFDSSGASRDIWANSSVRFHFPEGPHWTMDERTPLIALADQVPCFNLGDESGSDEYYPDQPTIHRPVNPYVLLPGDIMTAEAKLLDPDFWTMSRDQGEDLEVIDLWVHFRGYQEGTHVG